MPKTRKSAIDAASLKQIRTLMKQLTVGEKCSLLSGRDMWSTVPIPGKGIGSVLVTDGPHGVRAEGGHDIRKSGPATYFPTGASIAATWNPALIRRLGEALAEETKAYGCDVLLGPCVNIVRVPIAGRNFETLAEDPFLAGRLGAAYVNGLQGRGVGASLKHFACNNQETERTRGNSVVDERALREIYLAQFEHVVKESRPWTVMCAYNRVNGEYASQNRHLLTEILREEWGFEGLVISDWGANHTITESVAAGLDLEMPGPAKYYHLLTEALTNWQIEERDVDRAVRKLLELVARAGKLGKGKPKGKGAANTRAHQQLAREIAGESITLLKNDGAVLPLDPRKIRSVALIGLNALITPQGGGSSAVTSPYRVSPIEAFRRLLGPGVEVKHGFGCEIPGKSEVAPIGIFTTPDGKRTGLFGEYFNGASHRGKPLGTRIETTADIWWRGKAADAPAEGLDGKAMGARYTAQLQVEHDGTYQLDIDVQGSARVWVDGKQVLKTTPFEVWEVGRAVLDLKAGRAYDFKAEFVKFPAEAPMHIRIGFSVGAAGEAIGEAAELARTCDATVVFAGFADRYESECFDRRDMKLVGAQDKLVSAVLEANPDAVVVLNTGAPVELPWADRARTILQAYYPGMEGGAALADILFGRINPSGKLAVSYPRRLEDNPAFPHFPGGREAFYGEGVFVGYRYYDKEGIAPLFPFGHGLSYTTFEYGNLKVPRRARAGSEVAVSLTVRNTGTRRGKETVQLYVGDKESSVPRPVKELKGFAKVDLRPGESRQVEFRLDARSFAFYDIARAGWSVEPGEYEIIAASSSADIRATARLLLQ